MVGKQPILVNPNRCRNSEGKTKRRLTHRDNTFTPLVSKNGQYSERGKERRTTSRRYHQTKHSARFTSQRPRALEREYTLVAALIVGNRILGEKKKRSNYRGATNDLIHTCTDINIPHSLNDLDVGRGVGPFEILSCQMEQTIIPIGCTSIWMREGHRRYNRINVLEYAPIGLRKWLDSTFDQESRGAA